MEDKVQIILEAIERGKAQMEAAAKRIEDMTKATDRNAKANRDQDKGLLASIPTWAKIGAAISAATIALTAWIRTAINGADATRRQAEEIGSTTEKLSAFKFAADLADIGANNIVQAMGFMNRAMAEAGDASSKTGQLLLQLGIDTDDPIDATLKLADAFRNSSDAQAKQQISMALFGRSGREMISFLNQGSEAIRAQMGEAQSLSAVFSNELGITADQLNDNITRLKTAFFGWAVQIAEEITPTLVALSEIVLKLVANKEVLITVTTVMIGAFNTLVEVLLILKAGWDATIATVAAVIRVYAQFVVQIIEVYKRIYDVIKAVGGLGDVFRKVAAGDFTGAWQAATSTLANMKDAAVDVKNAVVDVFSVTGEVATETAGTLAGELTGIGTKTRDVLRGIGAEAQAVKAQAGAGRTPLGGKALPKLGTGDELTKRKQIADQLTVQLLEAEAKRTQSVDLMRQAALSKERIDYEKNLTDINALSTVSAEERHSLLEQAERLHQERILGIERETMEQRRSLLVMQLQATSETLSAIAGAIEAWGGKGTTAYKVFATAAAVIDTARAAISAYSATVGIPYVGPILAPIAAGAAVAFGAAQIAKINGAFAEGGIVPGAPSSTDNRLASVATGELILSAASTQAIIRQGGMAAVASLLRGSLPYGADFAGSYVPRASRAAFAAGGIVGPLPGDASRATTVDITLAEIRNRQEAREVAAREAAPIIVDRLTRRGNRIKA